MVAPRKLPETRALGWYAVQRVRIAGFLKPHAKQPDSSHVPKSEDMMSASTETGDADPSKKPKSRLPGATKPDPKVEAHLQSVVHESHTVLASAKAVFPFDLFPDTVTIDRHKLSVIHRAFWGVEKTASVPIENIKNIEADIGPFFGSVIITSDLFINNTQTVKWLTNSDARKIQNLVQGAVVAQREDIDLNKIGTKKLRTMLTDLGSGHTNTISS